MENNIEMRLNRLENKIDRVLCILSYLSATDDEKKYMFQDGSTNYGAICESCDDIIKEMIQMRNS